MTTASVEQSKSVKEKAEAGGIEAGTWLRLLPRRLAGLRFFS
jgi:hypothetical protein